MNFEELKEEILKRAKQANACKGQYQRAIQATTIDELIEVLKDNMSFAKSNDILTDELAKQYERPELFGIGKENTGFFNSGYLNSGGLNSGDLNSGYRNSGDRNSGDLNSGYRNSGDLNSGDLNSGYRNSGDRNSGDLNSGYRNSGDLNSGYRNSGVFCTRKREDTVPFFNKESEMTWDQWYDHPGCDITRRLQITEWVDWDSMSEDEKKEYPKAFVTGGRLKVYEYKQAWANLWGTLSYRGKEIIQSLPNFDTEVFREITGLTL